MDYTLEEYSGDGSDFLFQPSVAGLRTGRWSTFSDTEEDHTLNTTHLPEYPHNYSWNTTVGNTAQDNPVENSCGLVTFVLYGPVYGTICLFGLIGNALSFAVLHKGTSNRKSVSTLLLKALAVTDNLFLLFASMAQMFPAMAIYFKLEDRLSHAYPYVQAIVWPCTHITQMETTWMMVMVAANRFVAVCKPLRAQRLCTHKKVHLQIIIMTIAVIAYNIPRFLEYRYVKVAKLDSNNETIMENVNIGLSTKPLYNIIYENISYWVFVFLSPLLILIYLNFHLVRELNQAQKCRQVIASRQAKEENNITLVMIIIIVIFIICQAPASVNQILWYVLEDKHKSPCTPYMYFFNISNLLLTMNSSINFVIYCVFRRQFRRQLWTMCHGRKRLRYHAKFTLISPPSTYDSELATCTPLSMSRMKSNGHQQATCAFQSQSGNELYD